MYVGLRDYMEVCGSIVFTHVCINECAYEGYICVGGSQPGIILPPQGTFGHTYLDLAFGYYSCKVGVPLIFASKGWLTTRSCLSTYSGQCRRA